MLNLLWKQRPTKLFPFLDALIDNRNNISNTSTYHKSTYSGLLPNFDSFTFRFYKISLIKSFIDRAYKINNKWASFHNDVTKIKETFKRNSFRPFLIEKISSLIWTKCIVMVTTPIQNLIKHVFIDFHQLENTLGKFRKNCQKSVNSSAKIPILKLLLLLLKLITISQLKIKHPIF